MRQNGSREWHPSSRPQRTYNWLLAISISVTVTKQIVQRNKFASRGLKFLFATYAAHFIHIGAREEGQQQVSFELEILQSRVLSLHCKKFIRFHLWQKVEYC